MALMINQFSSLLDAVKTLNGTMDGVKTTLLDHGTKFDVLIRDALKNDQPYDQKALDDESTCLALYDIVIAKTKEKADEWNGTMDVTLIFIALFSAVLTAFLVPATQALLPNTTDSGNSTSTLPAPPLPARSDEAVCAFYYLSLITAIIIAVLCALGRQWVRKLTTKPDVRSWRERTMWHVERMKRAESWIRVLMEVLYWMLLSSIGLFMTGLLYQLWNVSHSFEERATILLATWALGVILVSGIVVTMIATTYHAVRYQGSVFEGLISKVISGDTDTGVVKVVAGGWTLVRSMLVKGKKWVAELNLRKSLKRCFTRVKGVALVDILQRARHSISALIMKDGGADGLRWKKPDWGKWMTALNFAGKMRQSIKSLRIEVQSESREKLLATYLDQISEASDPTLLERAVASLSYADWVQYGTGSIDQLEKVYSRLLSTDTSFRVKETVSAQVARFSTWLAMKRAEIETNRRVRTRRARKFSKKARFSLTRSKEIEERTKKEAEKENQEELRAIELTQFLIKQRDDRVSACFTPTKENYADILDLISLPFDRLIA
ncbi:hypothetical protein SISSUDRAFT_1053780 [Sistotremastrum suecicum HHB10207 ss-3]|uniref:DUF6535 domain-containing protein n=1 Tax=Sistotremastrum suecicum HHB10207 ss-3 TaxID=1314776 RepID=A0A165Z0D1_9AGAM|nr:hypothetical protein SISSUDRAFT_1053780 [Sistotremastrum suecicum HHB10207 ss-3]